MSPKKLPHTKTGMVNYYIPSPTKQQPEKLRNFLTNAGRDVPRKMRAIGARWDGSFWLFPTARYEDVVALAEKYDAKEGVRFQVLEEITVRNPDQIAAIVRDSLAQSIGEIVPSLRNSVNALKERFEELPIDEADGMIADRIRDAKSKLEDVLLVIASFAFTEHFNEVRTAIVKTIEQETELANSALAIEAAKRLKLPVGGKR